MGLRHTSVCGQMFGVEARSFLARRGRVIRTVLRAEVERAHLYRQITLAAERVVKLLKQ